jgi:ribosomal protein S18 acetylase RimI-like enzyme
MDVRRFEPRDQEAVVSLWERCDLVRPWNDPRKDIARKLRVQPELFLVGVHDEVVVATVMVGYDGHRGWINYLGVSPDFRRQGFGRAIMLAAERLLRDRGCPKINLQVRRTNLEVAAFYRAVGYLEDDVISLGKRLESDE